MDSIEKKLKISALLGFVMVLFCWPLGIYTSIHTSKIYSCLKVGDYNRAEISSKKIRTSWKVYLVFLGICTLIGIFTGLFE